jgi:primosomal protein N' (replication factor Y) (superfamily II helicase)
VVLCHSCDYSSPPPTTCPACAAPGVRYLGTGTQRLEQEVRTRFSRFPCLRMDSDTMRKPGSHDKALEAFRKGEIKILLGTQMISKGLDFPNVTLVGVIDADTVLHQPDLRATERTFQLIAQVSGRTGRSERGGRVCVQTSCPSEPAILLAARHDYTNFAERELLQRHQAGAPPYAHLVRVIVRGLVEQAVQDEARRMVETLQNAITAGGLPISLLGPAPAPVARLKGNFRYHFRLSSPEVEDILRLWRSQADQLQPASGIEYAVDVDPINLR